ERLALWRGAERLVAAHPLCGIGLGRYPGAQWAWTRAGNPLEPMDRPTLSEEAHDFYLQTAAEIGLLGLGLYGAALAAFVLQGLRHLRQTHRPRSASREALIIASLSVVAGQAIDAVASPSWQFAEASFLFWALLGLGMAALRREETEPAPVRWSPALRRAGRFALVGGVAVIMAANLLPIGLLTPVEAYTPPPGWTYVGGTTTVTPLTQSGSQGQTVFITMTAVFRNASGAQRTVDVSNDSTATYSAVVGSTGNTPVGTFVKGAATYSSSDKVAYTIPTGSSYVGKQLYLTTYFKVGATPYFSSPQAVITVSN
ncbi:MAG: O-antigen ligase family protein, partial [Armatimonadota bacterium]|nr:O-antigen ligase family protein [Armatimonadota bacterium]